jgi:tRNA threonylcarbamoyladenosine modification (KEOPS) complex  Pcc1 subunit
VELRISARDTGALRAALNTYLGWVELNAATESVLYRPES